MWLLPGAHHYLVTFTEHFERSVDPEQFLLHPLALDYPHFQIFIRFLDGPKVICPDVIETVINYSNGQEK